MTALEYQGVLTLHGYGGYSQLPLVTLGDRECYFTKFNPSSLPERLSDIILCVLTPRKNPDPCGVAFFFFYHILLHLTNNGGCYKNKDEITIIILLCC